MPKFTNPYQEDFIRGHMSRHPYASNEIGTTMREVSARICRDLELVLDADFGLELLVDNKIIGLDLPIHMVYEQVWRRSQVDGGGGREGPMIVVYRLQGLDGEATEEIVDSLDQEEDEEEDPETKFRITDVVGEGNGFDVLLVFVQQMDFANSLDVEMDRQLLTLVLNFISMCSQIARNRRVLAQKDGIGILLSKMHMCVQCNTETGSNDAVIHTILSVAAAVAAELSRAQHKGEAWTRNCSLQASPEAVRQQMASLLEHLTAIHTNAKLAKTVFGLLPFLTRGEDSNIKFLINFFKSHLDFSAVAEKQKDQVPRDPYKNCCYFNVPVPIATSRVTLGLPLPHSA